MACTTGCRTKDHATYGECLKAKRVRIPAIPVNEISVQKKADVILDGYAAARKQGIQPASTKAHDVDMAVRASDVMGEAYKA
jgi:hypothetical protein